MNQKHYHYVLAVAEEGSFSRAAQRLFIAQPSLSQCIQRIERQYGVALFERSFNRVSLTPAGERYLQAGAEILALNQKLLHCVQEVKNLRQGRLRIGMAPYRDCVFLAPAIRLFNSLYPGIEISLQEMEQLEIENLLAENKLDIAITMPPQHWPAGQFTVLFRDRLLLAIAPDYWYFRTNEVHVQNINKKFPQIHLRDMAQCGFILITNRRALRDIEEEACTAAGFQPKVILETKSIESAHTMAVAGLGATFVPESFLRFSKIKKCLSYYLPDIPAPEIVLGVLQPQKQALPVSAKRFIEILQEFFLKEMSSYDITAV